MGDDMFWRACPGLFFTLGADGVLRDVSADLRALIGPSLSPTTTLTSLVAPAQRERVTELLGSSSGEQVAPSATFELLQADADPLRVRCELRAATEQLAFGQLTPLPPLAQVHRQRLEKAMLETVMSTLEIALWAVDRQGTFVFQDGKATYTAGLEPGMFVGQSIFDIYPEDNMPPVHSALAGTPSRSKTAVHEHHWDTWYVPLTIDTDEVEFCVGLTLDISESVRTKRALEQQLETISAQQSAIHELSAPVLQVWDQVLAVPLIGALDRERTDELSERLLGAVTRTNVHYVILDLTGVDALDTSIANHLLRLCTSLGLLGVEGMVTGISPHVAQTMVSLGVDLSSVRTYRSLREALRGCMRAQERQ